MLKALFGGESKEVVRDKERETYMQYGLIGRKTPVKYEDLNSEAKSILSSQENWDGFKFEYNATLQEVNPFYVTHSISMGSAMEPASYNFGASVICEGTMFAGRIDTDGHVMGRMHTEFDNLIIRSNGQVSSEPHQSTVQAELDYKGSDWYGNFKWGAPGNYGLSFIKSITPQLSCGLETFYAYKQAVSIMSAGFRYDTHQYILATQFLPGQVSTSYAHKISDSIVLATELQIAIAPETIISQCSVGFDATYRSVHMRAHLDSSWKVSVIVEEMLNQITKFTVCADLDHKKKKL